MPAIISYIITDNYYTSIIIHMYCYCKKKIIFFITIIIPRTIHILLSMPYYNEFLNGIPPSFVLILFHGCHGPFRDS